MSGYQEKHSRFLTYLEKSGKSKTTINQYGNLVNNYFNFYGNNPDIEVSEARIAFFLDSLKESDYSTSYINTTKYALKAFCVANKISWEEGTYLFPMKLREDETINQPAFSLDQVRTLIYKVKSEPGVGNGFLFLISTYGLRQKEARELKKEDIDYEKGTIYIRTAKGGMPRHHLLPDIAKKLIDIDFKPKSRTDMMMHFQYICEIAGVEIPKGEGYGWHSIRRALVTELFNLDFREDQINQFLRWSNSSRIVHRYNKPDLFKLDREIFNNHPFLKFWEGNCDG